jgi:hypothetical protein
MYLKQVNGLYLFSWSVSVEIERQMWYYLHLKENMSKKISNVALLTFEGAAFNVTFLALLLILVYPVTMVLKQQWRIKIYL